MMRTRGKGLPLTGGRTWCDARGESVSLETCVECPDLIALERDEHGRVLVRCDAHISPDPLPPLPSVRFHEEQTVEQSWLEHVR